MSSFILLAKAAFVVERVFGWISTTSTNVQEQSNLALSREVRKSLAAYDVIKKALRPEEKCSHAFCYGYGPWSLGR